MLQQKVKQLSRYLNVLPFFNQLFKPPDRLAPPP
jgi:hypothetical protein